MHWDSFETFRCLPCARQGMKSFVNATFTCALTSRNASELNLVRLWLQSPRGSQGPLLESSSAIPWLRWLFSPGRFGAREKTARRSSREAPGRGGI